MHVEPSARIRQRAPATKSYPSLKRSHPSIQLFTLVAIADALAFLALAIVWIGK